MHASTVPVRRGFPVAREGPTSRPSSEHSGCDACSENGTFGPPDPLGPSTRRQARPVRGGMRNAIILGGGTAGTMTANKLHRALDHEEWSITVVDANDNHRYQPGFLFMPFGTYRPDQVTKSRRKASTRRAARLRRDRPASSPTRTACSSPTDRRAGLRRPHHRHRRDAATGPDRRA